jgi:hypothetical protein
VPTLRRPRARQTVARRRAGGGPVLLATLEAPFDPDAAAFAVDSAVESGQPLVIVNAVEIFPLPGALMGYGDVGDPPATAAALSAPAELAASLGVEVERLRVQSPHPVEALLEVAGERSPGLLVFGPDRSCVRPRLYRRAVRALRERAACLVWLADD